MKAAVLHEVNQPLQIEEVDIASPGPREVLVRTRASGVCHSDLHFVEGLYATTMPVVLGHEAAGTVEAVGSLVDYVAPGDRVICCLSVFCGHCERCTTGRTVLCSRTGLIRGPDETPRLSQGSTPVTQFANLGAYAEMMLVHENSLVKIEQEIGFEQMALIGCGATTGLVAAMNTAKVEPGSTVAVIGCGGVGLNAIQGARLAGALRIIAVDVVENKLALAKELGATDVIDSTVADPVARIRELTGGGADYTFDAIGLADVSRQAFDALRPGGTATVIGMIPEGDKVALDGSAFLSEKKIQGTDMGSNRAFVDMPRYVEFYRQGELRLDEMVTKHCALEDVNEAFRAMKAGEVARTVIMFE